MVLTPIESPATASWGLSISDSDFAKLKRGLLARSSDDRWAFLAMSDEELVEEEAQRLVPERKPSTPSTPEDELTEEEQNRRNEAFFEEMEREELERDERDAEWEAAADLIHLDVRCNISIRRAWSNTEYWRLVVKSRSAADGHAGTAKIEAITWGQNGHYEQQTTEKQAKMDVVLKCRAWLGCDIDAVPDYGPMELGSVF